MSEWTKERIQKLKKNSAIGVFGSYSLGEFYKGHKNINRFGVNVIDVNLNLTGGDNLFAQDLVELLNESLSMVNEIERLQSEVAELRSQQEKLIELGEQFYEKIYANQFIEAIKWRSFVDKISGGNA